MSVNCEHKHLWPRASKVVGNDSNDMGYIYIYSGGVVGPRGGGWLGHIH